eukprot:CAMPEP_0116879584 /NCGR_PEP_ID=MMETSP0463-20121206/11393_1 /TAXON_ID=181622 /ORGANISM="Strombidinopsis sp, Strain SopsisLIS2011" /LENGTH=95 /DNA_ID=CAMNT_0004529069 /DNA_START=512 /DNA_END=799 /DNA_ORIENTATION=+
MCLLKLKGEDSDKKLIVTNCHMFWHPRFDYVKFAQGLYYLKKVAEFARLHKKEESDKLPIIMAGDFNSMPNSSVLSLFDNTDLNDDNCAYMFPMV